MFFFCQAAYRGLFVRITKEHFIEQFYIPILVQALPMWHRRSKEPPDHVARAMYETIRVSRGELPIDSRRFGQIMEPVIAELHGATPKGQRPDARKLTARAYDALSAAGIEVTIMPPIGSHGNAKR
jgi:hypothetical protein